MEEPPAYQPSFPMPAQSGTTVPTQSVPMPPAQPAQPSTDWVEWVLAPEMNRLNVAITRSKAKAIVCLPAGSAPDPAFIGLQSLRADRRPRLHAQAASDPGGTRRTDRFPTPAATAQCPAPRLAHEMKPTKKANPFYSLRKGWLHVSTKSYTSYDSIRLMRSYTSGCDSIKLRNLSPQPGSCIASSLSFRLGKIKTSGHRKKW